MRRAPNRILRKLGIDMKLPGRFKEFPVHIWATHLRAGLPPGVFESCFRFSFVRNPWDWQVSLYHWYRDHPEHRMHEMVRKMSFDDYAEWRADTPPIYYQLSYLMDEKGELLVDYVGRFENLQNDFSEICSKIGVRSELQEVNITRSRQKRDYRAYFTDRSRELIGETYARDVDFFGYSFE